VYRCHVCRLELTGHYDGTRLVPAPLETDGDEDDEKKR
jgi:hypothetical protein